MAKKNNEPLIKNHQTIPTGTTAVTEVNIVDNHKHNRGGRGRNNERGHGRGHRQYLRPKNTHQKNGRDNEQAQNAEHACYKCGGKGHWIHICRTPKHLVKLYQKSRLKSEVHLVEKSYPGRETIHAEDTTQLDINDFYMDSQKE